MNQQSTEYLQGSETTLQDTIMVDTWHHKFVQIQRMEESKLECRLWNSGDDDVSACINSNKCITLIGDEDSGGGYACVGAGDVV